MDDDTPVQSEITVNSNPEENIDDVLSDVDGQYWQPDQNEPRPQITVTLTEEEKPITDIIVIGQYDKFVVTIYDNNDNLVQDEVSHLLSAMT